MPGTTPPRRALDHRVVAPATALAMLAVQVGASATSDALFLTSFSVTTLPWFVAAAAIATFPAAHGTGALLARFGPRRVVPAAFALGGVLFGAEAWWLPTRSTAVAVVLYFHATVLGAIVTSAFWSLLNERFDPHAAKGLFARVATAATLGSVIGGAGAAQIAASQSVGVLLAVLGAGTAGCALGAIALGRGADAARREDRYFTRTTDRDRPSPAPYVRALALLAALAALVGKLCDYVLKADVAADVAGGAPLVGFFGLFYAATGVAAFVVQAACAPAVLGRLGIAGALAVHPLAVGVAGLGALMVPSPWRGIAIRGTDVTLRRSLFRTGYELLYTPLPDDVRRAAKTTIDVGWDCAGSLAGAAVVFLLTRRMPAQGVTALAVACAIGAALELAGARRLPSGYLRALEQKLRRRDEKLPRVTHYSYSHVTVPHVADAEVPVQGSGSRVSTVDPVAAALADLRSDDPARIRSALVVARKEPALVGATIPLLGRKDLFNDAAKALQAHGARVVGQQIDALLDSSTPEDVRSRLPLVLASCVCRRARDGLVDGLWDPCLKVRERCSQALLGIVSKDATLGVPRHVAYDHAERELDTGSGEQRSMAHVFNLLALVHDRATMEAARRACETGDAQARGTALAYLEGTLPRALFAKLERRLAMPVTTGR